jgi:adenylate cyclase
MIDRTETATFHGAPFDPTQELRRFAPPALADRIERGEGIDKGEQEVSVLFADLRGYTAFAERRKPGEVFEVLSRYAALLARVVGDYSGQVVDFLGDGLMAVFGAPDALPHNARAAVAAAREICAVVNRFRIEDPRNGRFALAVGVGVATGPAYVGGIQVGERMFWSAVGSTTNKAARLQHLTRELQCAAAVDAPTRAQAGPLAAGFESRPCVSIPGYQAPEDVYILPMAAM